MDNQGDCRTVPGNRWEIAFPAVLHEIESNSEKFPLYSWVAKGIPEQRRAAFCCPQGNIWKVVSSSSSSLPPSENFRKSALPMDQIFSLELPDLRQGALWCAVGQKIECRHPSHPPILLICYRKASSDGLHSLKAFSNPVVEKNGHNWTGRKVEINCEGANRGSFCCRNNCCCSVPQSNPFPPTLW